MRLLVRRISTDSWEVGRSNRPTQFTPRGTGLLALARLLSHPGKPYEARALAAGEPCTARALRKRLLRTVDELCEIEGAFAFLRVAVGVSRETVLVPGTA